MTRVRAMRQRWKWLLLGALCQVPAAAPAADAPLLELSSIAIANEGRRVTAQLTGGGSSTLTLQPTLQHDALRLLERARPLSGVVLVLDLETGQLLALAEYRRRGAAPEPPATSYVPAASLFKMITTAALFEHTPITPKSVVCFRGGEHRIEREHLTPPLPRDARCAPFLTALGYSRNAVYAQLAFEHLMRDQLITVAERLGFNHALPFPVAAQVGTLELPYNDLEFARAAAGFVGSRFTPLGALHVTYAIAKGGVAHRMGILEDDPPGEPLQRVMSANTAWRLTRMMEVTVHSGTSLDAFTSPEGRSYLGSVRVAGKTGTLRAERGAPMTSWFTGFAPSRKPRYAVTVMLQNGKVWRKRANEVARDAFRLLFATSRGVSDPFLD